MLKIWVFGEQSGKRLIWNQWIKHAASSYTQSQINKIFNVNKQRHEIINSWEDIAAAIVSTYFPSIYDLIFCVFKAENDYYSNDIKTECYQKQIIMQNDVHKQGHAVPFRCFEWKCASRRRTMASIVMFNFHFQLNRSCKIIVIIIWYRITSPFSISFHIQIKNFSLMLRYLRILNTTAPHPPFTSMPFFFFFLFSNI